MVKEFFWFCFLMCFTCVFLKEREAYYMQLLKSLLVFVLPVHHVYTAFSSLGSSYFNDRSPEFHDEEINYLPLKLQLIIY